MEGDMERDYFQVLQDRSHREVTQRSIARWDAAEYAAQGNRGAEVIGPCAECNRDPVFKIYEKIAEAECPYCGETLAIRRLGRGGRWIYPQERRDIVPVEVAA